MIGENQMLQPNRPIETYLEYFGDEQTVADCHELVNFWWVFFWQAHDETDFYTNTSKTFKIPLTIFQNISSIFQSSQDRVIVIIKY